MKFKLTTLSWSLVVALTAGMTHLADAQTVSVSSDQVTAGAVFEITDFVLVREADVLTNKTQEQVLAVLASGKGAQQNMQTLNATIAKAQGVLDQVAPGAFVLCLAPQAIYDKGNVLVLISPVLSNVKVSGINADEAQQLQQSMPATLQKGAVLSGNKWPAAETVAMLNDHPLKVTTVQYNIERDKPVSAELNVVEPYGKSQTAVTVDTYGNQVIGRGMASVSHQQSDVATLNDVLSVYGATSLHSPAQVSVGSVRYTTPDMASHMSHTVGLVYSSSNVDTPFLAWGNIAGKGSYSELSYRQTHFMDWGKDLGFSNTKLMGDVALTKSKANTQFFSSSLTDYSVSALPVTLGLESMLRSSASDASDWVTDFTALNRVQLIANRMGMFGLSDQVEYDKARVGSGKSTALRLFFDTRTTISNDVRLNIQYAAQFTKDKLMPSAQTVIAGDRLGVRGFMNAALLGDSTKVLRTELEPLMLRSDWDGYVAQPYVFYDVGHKRGGNDERELTASSRGLGLRLHPGQVNANGFSADVFGARKTHGADLDLIPGSTNTVSKTTFWATGTYRF